LDYFLSMCVHQLIHARTTLQTCVQNMISKIFIMFKNRDFCNDIYLTVNVSIFCYWNIIYWQKNNASNYSNTHNPIPNFADVSVSLCQSRIRTTNTLSMYTGPSWNKRHQGHVSRSLYQLPIPVAIPRTTYTGTLSNTNDKRHHHNGVQSSSSGV